MSTKKESIPIDECLFGPGRSWIDPNYTNGSNDNDVPVTPPRKGSTDKDPPSTPSKESEQENDNDPHIISLPDLRRTVSQGIIDRGSHRPVAWRVLLGFLPPDTSEWHDLLQKERALYRSLLLELFVMDPNDLEGWELRGHHSKRVNQWKREHAPEEVEDTPEEINLPASPVENDLEPIDTLLPGRVKRRASFSGTPTMEAAPPMQRSKSLGDLTSVVLEILKDIEKEEETETASVESDITPPRSNTTPVANRKQIQKTPSSDGYSDFLPKRIKEQWKRSGRDQSSLEGMSGGMPNMNTLLVIDNNGFTPGGTERKQITVNDNEDDSLVKPADDDSKWSQFYENATLLDEIRKDVVRTHPDLHFFLEPKHNLGQRRYAAIERILFVWSKLNKGVRYVQGMNEIVGTLYYVLANDFNEEWACHAEADAYFLFNILLVEIRDVFVPDLDEADTGIQGRISHLVKLLSMHDPEVSCHLSDCGIDASFYAIRWLTTLLSREFLLPDTIRLWDSMFASTHKDNFLRYVCVTMVMLVRKDLLKGDFSSCLRLLQSYPPTNVDDLLEASRALWIYESQITLACHKGGISLQKALASIAPPPAIIMAYGLPGGVTFKHSDRELLAAPNSPRKDKKSASEHGSNNFMSSAKGMIGDIRERYKKHKAMNK